jgi:hypothetical protein
MRYESVIASEAKQRSHLPFMKITWIVDKYQ